MVSLIVYWLKCHTLRQHAMNWKMHATQNGAKAWKCTTHTFFCKYNYLARCAIKIIGRNVIQFVKNIRIELFLAAVVYIVRKPMLSKLIHLLVRIFVQYTVGKEKAPKKKRIIHNFAHWASIAYIGGVCLACLSFSLRCLCRCLECCLRCGLSALSETIWMG